MEHYIYKRYVKRILDFIVCLGALLILSPIFVFLTIIGAIVMRGNPFFLQDRPGKNEKIFRILKFRTMTNEKDENGYLLPDKKRICKYGNMLRKTSLDELPEIINIIKGDMSLIGPRPLLVEYLPYYTEEERHRHDIRPGLTGWAQINGRNFITWEETFQFDLYYLKHMSFYMDVKIFLKTIKKVFSHEDITDATQGIEDSSGRHVHDALNIEREKS